MYRAILLRAYLLYSILSVAKIKSEVLIRYVISIFKILYLRLLYEKLSNKH